MDEVKFICPFCGHDHLTAIFESLEVSIETFDDQVIEIDWTTIRNTEPDSKVVTNCAQCGYERTFDFSELIQANEEE